MPSGALGEASALLVATNGSHALRAVPGTCQRGGARLEGSADGGRTWQQVEPPAPALLQVGVADQRTLSVLGATEACVPLRYASSDQGASWQETGGADWFVLLDDDRRLRTPSGEVSSPCRRSLRLDPLAPNAAALLCASGSVYLSDEGGQSWSRRQGIENAVAFDFVDALNGWILAPGARCGTDLEVLATDDGALSWESRGCVATPHDVPVGFAFADENSGLLVAGAQTYGTEDGGRTWERRS